MKLTQYSLPPRGPLRASCSACSTTNPPTPSHFSPMCFWFDRASDTSLHHLFSCCMQGVKAKTVFVVSNMGHRIQTKPLCLFSEFLSLNLMNTSVLFSGAAQLRWRGRQRIPVQPECGWSALRNRTMIWRRHRTPDPVLPLLLLPFCFCFIYWVTASLLGCFELSWRARRGQTERHHRHLGGGRNTTTAIRDLLPLPLLLPPQHQKHGEEKDSDSEDHRRTEQTG